MRLRYYAPALGVFMATSLGALAERLPGSEWEPTEISGAPFEPASETFVRFEQDGMFFGNGGCNTLRGRFVTNGDAILFGPAAATMMACPEPIMSQERTFTEVLMAARTFARDGIDLTLSDAEGTVLMRLRQRDAD